MKINWQQWARNHRICFRTTRMNQSWVKDMAHEHGWTSSTMIHWIVEYAMADLGPCNGPEERIAAVSEKLGPTGLELLRRDIKRGLDKAPDDVVPW
jgi:hypothetical protein